MKVFCNRLCICAALLLALLLGGCTQTGTSVPTASTANVTVAAPTADRATIPDATGEASETAHSPGMDYLLTLYEGKDFSSPIDYSLINFIELDGVKYRIHWSVDVAADTVAISDNGDGTATVDVNELSAEDVSYTLTARISTADGLWATHNWKCTLPKARDAIKALSDARALEHGGRLSYPVTLTGKVTSIVKDYDEDYGSVTILFQVPDAGNQTVRCYGLLGSGIEKLKIGYVIAVTGYLQNFGSMIDFDSGCTLKIISEW